MTALRINLISRSRVLELLVMHSIFSITASLRLRSYITVQTTRAPAVRRAVNECEGRSLITVPIGEGDEILFEPTRTRVKKVLRRVADRDPCLPMSNSPLLSAIVEPARVLPTRGHTLDSERRVSPTLINAMERVAASVRSHGSQDVRKHVEPRGSR